MKAIADGEIEERTRFKANYETFIARDGYLFKEYSDKQEYATTFELNWDFKLIEDEIDIDNIKEIKWTEINGTGDKQDEFVLEKNGRYICANYDDVEMELVRTINELIQAVKQIDKRVKELNRNEKS